MKIMGIMKTITILTLSILLISCTRNAEETLTSIVGGTFSQHYNKAIEYYKQEKYDQAEKEFEEAVEIKPNDVYTLYGLGNTYYCRAKYGDAVKVYIKAINLDPDYAKVHYSLSLAYAKLGMTSEAENEKKIFRELSKSKEAPDEKNKSYSIFTAETSDKIDKIISELSSMNYRSNTVSRQKRFIEIFNELFELFGKDDIFSEANIEKIGEEALKRANSLGEMIDKFKQGGKITTVEGYEMATDELLKVLLGMQGQESDELLRSVQETRATKVYETWDAVHVGYTTYRVHDFGGLVN